MMILIGTNTSSSSSSGRSSRSSSTPTTPPTCRRANLPLSSSLQPRITVFRKLLLALGGGMVLFYLFLSFSMAYYLFLGGHDEDDFEVRVLTGTEFLAQNSERYLETGELKEFAEQRKQRQVNRRRKRGSTSSRFGSSSSNHGQQGMQPSSSSSSSSSWARQFLPESEQPDRACFIHVGKTAGSTISCVLGVNNSVCAAGSSEEWQAYESVRPHLLLADQVTKGGYTHMFNSHCHGRTNMLLVSTRNPLTRMNSWFFYEKTLVIPDKSSGKWGRQYLFVDCYNTTFEDMVLQGLSHDILQDGSPIPADVRSMTCPQRAWAAVMGDRQFSQINHNYYNYEYYHQTIKNLPSLRTKQKYVLRTEHLAEDWDRIDELLKQRQLEKSRKTTSTELADTNTTSSSSWGAVLFSAQLRKKRMKTELQSPEAIRILCHALCLEIQYYKLILKGAANINEEQYLESIAEIQETCPEQTPLVQKCPDMPQFPRVPSNDWFIGTGKLRLKCFDPKIDGGIEQRPRGMPLCEGFHDEEAA